MKTLWQEGRGRDSFILGLVYKRKETMLTYIKIGKIKAPGGFDV
jgi:hypothetical protein